MGCLKADHEFVRYLQRDGYHPRSSKHGDMLCELLLDDLMESCPVLRKAAEGNRICYNQNQAPGSGVPLGWNIDLAIGPPSSNLGKLAGTSSRPHRAPPERFWIAVDAKTIMTEHGKARRNRQRDLNSFSSILHMTDAKMIVGGLVVLNQAPSFTSPLRSGGPTTHKNIERLIPETIKLFEDLPRAPHDGHSPNLQNQIDAIGVIVIEYDNIRGHPARLVTESPAPQPGSPLHYHSFVRDICSAFNARYSAMVDD